MTKSPARILGLIPARAGSKRLPGKNTADCAGKPLIAWTIEAAVASKGLDKVVVSTNDPAVAEIASRYPVEILIRPESLSDAAASSAKVVEHALGEYPSEYACLLQPTSPLRTTEDIDLAIAMLAQTNAVVSVSPLTFPISWCAHLDEESGMDSFKPVAEGGSTFRLNGAIYLFPASWAGDLSRVYQQGQALPLRMPASRGIDIDYEEQLWMAEGILRRTAGLERQ